MCTLTQASGVNVSDQCVQYYNELKTSRKYKYVFFKLDDDMKEVIVDTDRIGEPGATYDDFVAQIKSVANECRYAIYNFEWETKEGGKREKIVFYSWCVGVANSAAWPAGRGRKLTRPTVPVAGGFALRTGAPTPRRSRRRWFTPHPRTPCARSSSVSAPRCRAPAWMRSTTTPSWTRSPRARATSKCALRTVFSACPLARCCYCDCDR